MPPMQSLKAFLVPKLHRIVEFLAKQGITMAGNLFYGFLCVRLLPISEYAMFAVVFGVLGTISVLMDISFTSALLPLIGERIDDRQLIADYVASLRQLAHWLYMLIAPITIVAYPLFVHRLHWSWHVVTAMVAILLLASWCARMSGAYGAVLVVRRDRKSWYRAQMLSSLGTLALLLLVWKAHLLSALSAILINVLGIVYIALVYFFRSRKLLGVTGTPIRHMRKAIIHLSLPGVPNVLFYAVQGQVALLLITIFGHATEVASIGALGRLAQVFVLFGQMTPLLIEPYFASLPRARLKRSYLGLLAAEGMFCLFIAGTARAFPHFYLWILGHKYSGLNYEVFLLMSASSLMYFSGVLWVVHNSRRFVYWWNGAAVITLTLAVQVFFIYRSDVSSIRGILTMNLWTAYANILIALFTGVYGFVCGPRVVAKSPNIAVENNYA